MHEASIAPKAHCSILCQAETDPMTQQSLGVWGHTAVVECLEQHCRAVCESRAELCDGLMMSDLSLCSLPASLHPGSVWQCPCRSSCSGPLSCPPLPCPGGCHPRGPAGAEGEGVHRAKAVRSREEGGVPGLCPVHGAHPGVPPAPDRQHQVRGAPSDLPWAIRP